MPIENATIPELAFEELIDIHVRKAAELAAQSQTTSSRYGPKSTQRRMSTYVPTFSQRQYNSVHVRRAYHTSPSTRQQLDYASQPESIPPFLGAEVGDLSGDQVDQPRRKPGIRDQLREWNEKYGKEEALVEDVYDFDQNGERTNTFTRVGDNDDFRNPAEAEEAEREELSNIMNAQLDELEAVDPGHTKFLRKGDLVELDFPTIDRESVLAIFVRNVGSSQAQSQFYTIHGKWIHVASKVVQYNVPGYVDERLVDKILPYLPSDTVTKEQLDRAQMFDLSVPREIAAPLVSRMLEFKRESDELFRSHASALDDAHNILAHPTDLKFGNLEQIGAKLLGTPLRGKKLPPTALFTVRKALLNCGFAFGTDRRSHRATGYIQIRSKEQVNSVERVRRWMRQWQEDLATATTTKKREEAEPRPSEGGRIMTRFLKKARQLIEMSRKDREATSSGNVGPSKKRFPMDDENCVRYKYSIDFTDEDQQILRFMEGWCCSNLYWGLPRLQALPPLILQATGMYEDKELDKSTGFMFLQEVGLLVPYENRVRYDQHLLLPSSQHSKPLENLMTAIEDMRHDPGFNDSMKHLRKDFGDLPVFCIDSAGAHEIDDGISIESAGNDEHWVNVHIANPTAFFSKDSPLAKMARHMTETVYMPERAFSMLPKWASRKYFSLEDNRPCLTFSAKMNGNGEVLQHKIQPGFIRNVLQVTPEDLSEAFGLESPHTQTQILSVGGSVKAEDSIKRRKIKFITAERKAMLETLSKLANKLSEKRTAAGGLFYDSARNDISVWSSNAGVGLPWEHPSRQRARHVEGDPTIVIRAHKFVDWFSAKDPSRQFTTLLVREMMLLACNIAAKWCAERNLPNLYRGSISLPGANPDKYWREVIEPAREKYAGNPPMHLTIGYLRNMGANIITTEPRRHVPLGLDHYSKATSPLRRYSDMITHWQIEAALRHEAETNQSLIGSNSGKHDFLPFSASAINQIIIGLSPRERMITRFKAYAESFWITLLFFRAHYFGELELPKTFNARITSDPPPGRAPLFAILEENNVNASLQRPEDHGLGEAKAGDTWEAEIADVQVFNRRIVVKPLRLVDRFED